MKKIHAALLAGVLIAVLLGLTVNASTAEFYTVTVYAEVFTPVNAADAVVTVEVEAEPDKEGYIYIEKSVKGMEPTGDITGENIAGFGLEEYKAGSIDCYRIKTSNPSGAAKVKARFNCAGFYAAEMEAEENGSANTPISYKFTNYFANAIGKYSVKIVLPEDTEIIKVSTPAKYADFKLSEQDGLRAISVSKSKLAPAAAVTLAFVMGSPAVSTVLGKVMVWMLCLAIGMSVLFARIKESKVADKK